MLCQTIWCPLNTWHSGLDTWQGTPTWKLMDYILLEGVKTLHP